MCDKLTPDIFKSFSKLVLLQMRNLDHENVNTFLGLCKNGLHVLSVWKPCRRGCLFDVLKEHRFQLTWLIKYILIKDITEVGIEEFILCQNLIIFVSVFTFSITSPF